MVFIHRFGVRGIDTKQPLSYGYLIPKLIVEKHRVDENWFPYINSGIDFISIYS